jgi:hypothetical protein
MVIIQHISEESMLGGFSILKTSGNSLGSLILLYIYILCRVAVNVFILISGYFMIKQKSSVEIGKIINLLFMTSMYSLICYFIKVALGMNEVSFSNICYAFFPKNYYVYLYVCLCILSPYINKLIEQLNREQYRKLLLLLIILFGVWSTISMSISVCIDKDWSGIYTVSLDGSGRGFTIVSFIVIYLIGGYIRCYSEEFNHKSALYWLCCMFAISIMVLVLITIYPSLRKSLLNYDSIFIIAQSYCTFLIFKNINIGCIKIINIIGKTTFGAFLLHYSIVKALASFFKMETAFSSGTIKMLLVLIMITICSLIISSCMDWILRLVVNPITHKWKENKIYKYKIVSEL